MPTIKGSKRRVNVSRKRKESNIPFRSSMKTAIKNITNLTKPTKEALSNAFKKIDKALKKGIIKKNTAARKKSRLSKIVNETEKK